jgi:hypothetical protein
MYLGIGTDRFVKSRDWLGSITASLTDPPRTALLTDLLPKARRQDRCEIDGSRLIACGNFGSSLVLQVHHLRRRKPASAGRTLPAAKSAFMKSLQLRSMRIFQAP